MSEQTPYVVDDRFIVYAASTMEAAARYREACGAVEWPTVRQADDRDLAQLDALTPAGRGQAA